MGKLRESLEREFLHQLERNPVIPAVYSEDESLDSAVAGEHPAVFVLGGDFFNLVRKIDTMKYRPPICVNVDLVGGVAGDVSGVQYLSEHVEGIISTNSSVIQRANAIGLFTVQRLFAIDAGAIKRGVKLIKRSQPRCVEILPGLAYPQMVARYSGLLDRPLLAGGLVRNWEEVSMILEAGASGVSTSHQELWEGAFDSKIET